jgi:hypothetical protein
LAALDQASAGIESVVDGFLEDIRVLGAVSHGEALLALVEVLDGWERHKLALIASGALLRLAKEQQ